MKAQGHELMPLAKKRNLQVIKQEQINKMSTSSLFYPSLRVFKEHLIQQTIKFSVIEKITLDL